MSREEKQPINLSAKRDLDVDDTDPSLPIPDSATDDDEGDPESQNTKAELSYSTSLFSSLMKRNLRGNTYENVFTIDEDGDLGEDVNDLMRPLTQRKRQLMVRYVVCPLLLLFALMTILLGAVFILSVEGIDVMDTVNSWFSFGSHGNGSIKRVPKEIAKTCSQLNLKAKSGWDDCTKMCSVAKCCISPINSNGSCLEDYEVQCSAYYHYCKYIFDAETDGKVPTFSEETGAVSESSTSVITSSSIIPPAPRDIGLICSQTNLQSIEGFSECEKICLPASCCTTASDQSCRDNNECVGYNVCANLQDESKHNIVSSTPTLLQKVCGYKILSTEGRSQCENACKPAKCCFSEDCDDIPENKEINCMEYERCYFLFDDANEKSNSLPSISNSDLSEEDKIYLVKESCTSQFISTDSGRKACYDLCKERSCCYLNEYNTCYSQKKQWCDEFSACELLKKTPVNNPLVDGTSTSIDVTCSKQDISDCKEQCHTRACCFSSDLEENCYDDFTSWCDEYVVCKAMFFNTGDIPDLTPSKLNVQKLMNKEFESFMNELTLACQQDTTPPYHLQDSVYCHDYCQFLECCFVDSDDNDYCGDKYSEYCAEFGMCKVMFNQNDVTTDEKSVAPPTLDEVCSNQHIIQHGSSDCMSMCKVRECCFNPPTASDSCYDNNPAWCDEYQECTKLDAYAQQQEKENIVTMVKEACYVSPNKASTHDFTVCADLCKKRLCCFEQLESKSCYNSKTEWCEDFAPCYKLNIDDLLAPPVSNQNNSAEKNDDGTMKTVEEACSSKQLKTPEGMIACSKQCNHKHCCFRKDGSVCQTDQQCDKFAACEAYFDKSTEQHEELKTQCNNRQVIADNYGLCSDICQQRACCFAWGADAKQQNCYAGQEAWCDEFHVCYNLNWIDVTKDKTANLISEACSKRNLITEAGREMCMALCEDRTCCFSQKPNTNCYNTNMDFCLGYEDCKNLYVTPQQMTAEFCDKTELDSKLGYNICTVICSSRSCCFQQASNEKSCFNAFTNWCNEFSACYNLDMDEIMSKHILTVEEEDIVETVCSRNALEKNGDVGRADCHEICSERYCCFASGRGNCSKERKEWCEEFSSCNNLYSSPPKHEENIDEICSFGSISQFYGLEKCKKLCADKACCFATELAFRCNRDDDMKETCQKFSACENLTKDTGVGSNTKNIGNKYDDSEDDYDADLGKLNDDLKKLQLYCPKKLLNIGDNYNKCHQLCNTRSCCFSWEKNENCFLDNIKWCKEFKLCYNLDWGDVEENYRQDDFVQEELGDIGLVVSETCSRLNLLTLEGKERCEEVCEGRECCYSTGSNNCYDKRSNWCAGFEPCANLDLSTKDYVDHYCDKKTVSESGLGYSVCSVLCTSRLCCFQGGSPDACAEDFPDFCNVMNSCYNIDIERIVKAYDRTYDSDIVTKVCSNVNLLPEGHQGIEDCRELCSERGCCFLPGRDNCAREFSSWCNEFAECKNLQFNSVVSRPASPKGGGSNKNQPKNNVGNKNNFNKIKNGNKNNFNKIKNGNKNNFNKMKNGNENNFNKIKNGNNGKQPKRDDDYDDDYADDYVDDELNGQDPEVKEVEHRCSKANIVNGDNYGKCREICSSRACCFHWGKKNCFDENENWCDDFRLCYNLDWADLEKNSNEETGDIDIIVEEACSKLNVLTEAGRQRCDEICDTRDCCFANDNTNCYERSKDWCRGYEACSNLYMDTADFLKEYCASDRIATDLGLSVCKVLCTTRLCCFKEGDANCFAQYPDWCSDMQLCHNLDIQNVVKNYNDKTDGNIVEKLCADIEYLPEGDIAVTACKQVCSERACCFFPGRDNCSSDNMEWCDEFAVCHNLDAFTNGEMKQLNSPSGNNFGQSSSNQGPFGNNNNNKKSSNFGKITNSNKSNKSNNQNNNKSNMNNHNNKNNNNNNNRGKNDNSQSKQDSADIALLQSTCTKSEINKFDHYHKCQMTCFKRSCCFRWGRTSCFDERRNWCDEFRLCYNLDWADLAVNSNTEMGDIDVVVHEACSRVNMLTHIGRERCSTICEGRECCAENNCKNKKPGFCAGYEGCSNLNLDAKGFLDKYCHPDKKLSEMEYSICTFLCTTRMCCFQNGSDNCRNEYPKWCDAVSTCHSINMKDIIADYDSAFDGTVVKHVCSVENFEATGHWGREACRELCAGRGCCFLPGRDNCKMEHPGWCNEFEACNNLDDLFRDTDDYALADPTASPIASFTGGSSGFGGNSGFSGTSGAVMSRIDAACDRDNVKTEQGRYDCENMCKERSCCFLVGFGNCYTSSQEWCDEYKSCENLFFGS